MQVILHILMILQKIVDQNLFSLSLNLFLTASVFTIANIVLGLYGDYVKYYKIFNVLALLITIFLGLSSVVSILGIVLKKEIRLRFIVMLATNIIFFFWIINE